MTRNVILAPGLWMPGAAMLPLAARLERRGYRVAVFGYRGRAPFEANLAQLASYVRRSFNGDPVALVGHSLGGVLMLDMLNRHPELEPAAVVLLGAPVRGCLAGRRLGSGRLGRWMMGECGALWNERPARWARGAPLGVVAGTQPLGLGRAFGRLPGLNDGVVRVDETTVEGMTERALVPRGHSMLVVSARVSALVERFLASGSFA